METVTATPTAPGLARLVERAELLRLEYLAAEPWPHLVLTDLFDPAVLRAAADETRAVEPGRMVTATTSRMVKHETGDVAAAGPACAAVFDVLDGDDFLGFLRDLTGIDDLESDPTHHWAGIHATPVDGFTMVHTDFRKHPETGLWHRTNVLVYLNEGWRPQWGGQLELWTGDMRRLGRAIEPELGTVVVFETGARTYHGLPTPVASGDGRSRLSLAAYHYSRSAPPPARRRLSKYQPRPGDSPILRVPTRWDLKERVPARLRAAAARARQLGRRP